ncbi:uncharacterized protein LOC124871713 [Girardinichthys multiradiatus]|uniref:uncharacterized protein LOC124871713 n=1 Tax=Girardinichthys multiradiatus TaxID=208333 RepID=UPI001FAD4C2F|nr:uncharacterized protein LOC124871713 [Girardinichthys multiradiatus]
MQHLCVVLILAIVSGIIQQATQDDTKDTVTGYLHQDLLLRCDCKGLNRTRGFKWQITMKKGFCYLNSGGDNNCTRPIETFKNVNIDNCSIRLTSITEEDTGTYVCLFTSKIYTRNIVHLKVNMTSLPSDSTSSQVQDPSPSTGARTQVYFPIIAITAVLLLFGCILTVLCKQRRNLPMMEVNQEYTSWNLWRSLCKEEKEMTLINEEHYGEP